VDLDELRIGASGPSIDVLALDESLGELERLDPRAAKVVELRYFGGYTDQEVVAALGVSLSTVRRDWQFALKVKSEFRMEFFIQPLLTNQRTETAANSGKQSHRVTTSSHAHDNLDCRRQSPPLRDLILQAPVAGLREPIVFGAPVAFGLTPLRPEPSLFFQAVQSGIQSVLVDFQNVVRDLLNPLARWPSHASARAR
jgi:hypothetical protein